MLHALGQTGAVWARLLIVIASPQWSPAFLEWLKLLIEKLTVKQVLLRTSVILQLELGMAKSHFMFRKPECFLTMGLRLWKEWTSGSVWNARSVRESILMSGGCLRLQLPCGFRLATFGRQNDMEKWLASEYEMWHLLVVTFITAAQLLLGGTFSSNKTEMYHFFVLWWKWLYPV